MAPSKMNKKPISYLQNDPRWKNKPYRVKGESSTIGSAGCGPTCAAMLIETLTGKTFTPEEACQWSVTHGYKALRQGTYYSYFKPQFEAFGIKCDMLNWINTYGKPDHPNHEKALKMLQEGYYLIALMNKGLWTSGGHFIVVWWQDEKVHIHDPASTKQSRIEGDLKTFRSQVKYYWWVDARDYNRLEEDMSKLTQAEFNKMADKWLESKKPLEPGGWSSEERQWAEEVGIIKGNTQEQKLYKTLLTREEFVVVLYRFFKVLKDIFKSK